MKSRLKRIVILALVVLAAIAGVMAYVRFWSDDQDHGGKLVLYGNVDIRQVDLAFNVAGRIEALLVEEGDAIQMGQTVARLDDVRYRAAVEAAQALVQSRKAVVARLEAGSRSQEIEKARADVRAAEGVWETAQETLVRRRKLASESFASQQALDDAVAAETVARGRLEALRQVLALAVAGPRSEVIAEARGNLAAAEADHALAKSRLDDTVLKAPIDGIMLNRIKEPGSVILENTPVYSLALSNPLWVRTYVSEPDLGRIFTGMKATISSDSTPGKTYDGWVGFISPTAEFTPKTVQTAEIRTNLVYRVTVYAENPDRSLRQGMPVTVRLIEEPRRKDSTHPGASPN